MTLKDLEAKILVVEDQLVIARKESDAWYDELDSTPYGTPQYFVLRDKWLLLNSEVKRLSAEFEELYKLHIHYLKSNRATTGAGRPKIGVRRNVSVTLSADDWAVIDSLASDTGGKLATVIRDLVRSGMEVMDR